LSLPRNLCKAGFHGRGSLHLMTIQRMDNVGIVVRDLDAAIAFFSELGMERKAGLASKRV
jgi:hypothetical protein